MAAPADDSDISSMKVSPRFLESNATCHTWVFSAFAELIDNSCDAKAKEVDIDEFISQSTRCVSVQDDGLGMSQDRLHHMLSFGYSAPHRREHIGMYGNGFKSGSMRLGKDVIVLTRTADSAGIGLLSQTYLKAISADNVRVPMLHYTFPGLQPIEHRGRDTSLTAILQHSPFKEEEELINKLTAFTGTGTLIIIYNLRKVDKYDRIELDFTKDPHDICCPGFSEEGQQNTASYMTSLREYCSILYLHPKMKIKIRGTYVKTRLIDKSLKHAKIDEYRPSGETKSYKITFGQMPGSDRSGDYGIMFYRENRLIKPYEKVACQRQNDLVGVGVMGVTDAGFLTPVHSKQDFVRNDKFIAAMKSYSIKLRTYWDNNNETSSSNSEDTDWVQCDYKECLRWRRLPHGYDTATLPEKWYCHLHPHGIDCSFPEDVHFADEKIKRGRKKRQENDSTTRLQPKRKSMDGGAGLNGSPGKQAKISMFLQLKTPRSGCSDQDVNQTRSVIAPAMTPSCSTSGETSNSSSLRRTQSLGSSVIIDGQPAVGSGDSSVIIDGQPDVWSGDSSVIIDGQPAVGSGDSSVIIDGQPAVGSGDSSERLSSEHADGGVGTTITGDDQLFNTARGYNSTRGDNFTSSRGQNSTRVNFSTKRDNSVRGNATVMGDNSIKDDYSTREDISNGDGMSAREDYSTREDISNGDGMSAREDYSTRGDNSIRGVNSARGHTSVNGDDTAYGANSANSKQRKAQSCSFITKQDGDCPNSTHDSNKRKCPDIKVEPAGESSEIDIRSEPAGESSETDIRSEPAAEVCHNCIKLAGNQGYIVVVALRRDETNNPEMAKLRVKLSRQRRLAGETTTLLPGDRDRKVADLQKNLNEMNQENTNLRNQLKMFQNNVRQLLRRLRPHHVIDNNANIEQLVDKMLAGTV